MSNTKLVFNNFLSLLSSEVITKLFSFVSVIYLARVLGPSGFGEISFAMAVFMFFLMFSTLGLDILGTREIAKDRNKLMEYVFEIGCLKLFLSLLAYILLWAFVMVFISSAQMRWLILLYGLSLFAMAFLFEWVFQGVEQMHFIAISRLISNAIYLALVVALVKSSAQMFLVPLFYFLQGLIAAFVLIAVLFFVYRKTKLRFDWHKIRELFFLALPIGSAFVLAQVYYGFDSVMLGFMKNSAEVGYYNAAFKVYMIVVLLAGIYHSAMFPRITRLFQDAPSKLSKIYNQSNKILAIFAVPLTVGGIIVAPKIMNLFYGQIYQPGVLSLQILLCGTISLYINTGYHRGLLACHMEKWYFVGVLVPVIVNIILNLLLIPAYGLNGAAFATLMGEVSAFIVSYVGFNQIVRAPFLRYLYKPFFASVALMFFVFWGLKAGWNAIIIITSAAVLYMSILFIINGLNTEDLKLLRHAFAWSKEE